MIEALIVGSVIGILVVIIIILNWREKKADQEINVFTSLPFEPDKRIKPKD